MPRLLLLASAALSLASLGVAAAPEPLRLAGRLVIPAWKAERWGWAGAWLYPVGSVHDYLRPAGDDGRGYTLLRGVGGGAGGGGHQGVDLGNNRGGGVVRAAAAGLVVVAAAEGWHSGYGRHVVIAHRAVDGALTYSVYAHLAEGTLRVRRGQTVAAAQPIARVGRSGRASTEHLHFEVREALEPGRPWEKARVLDPLAFVAERLPAHHADSSWAGPYLEWAELGGLIPPDARGEDRLARRVWWRLVAYAARSPLEAAPHASDSLRQSLIEAGVLPGRAPRDDDGHVTWHELAQDLSRLKTLGLRLPAARVPQGAHRATCEARLGTATPARHLKRLGSGAPDPPTLAQACLACADLTLPPDQPKPRVKSPRS